MQFDGGGVVNLSLDDRMTIANMAIEAGGKNGIFEFDSQTQAAVDQRCKLNNTKAAYEPVERDRDEKFVYEMIVDMSKLEPTVACHPDPGRRKLARVIGRDQSRPRLRRFLHRRQDERFPRIRARRARQESRHRHLWRARHARKSCMTCKPPDGRAKRFGTSWWTPRVQMTENAGCAACLGGPVDTFGRMNAPLKCISATNRNFPGRMGDKESQVFLASPAHGGGERVDRARHRSA